MRLAVITTTLCLSIVALSAPVGADASMRGHTDIPAQELRPALQRLSKDRDIQVVFRTDVVGEIRTSGATGELTVSEALGQLLSGTGLTYRYLDDKTVTIVSAVTVPTSLTAPSLPATPPHDQAPSGARGDAGPDGGKTTHWWSFHLTQANQGSAAASSSVMADGERSAKSRGNILEEVVVTARRREEDLQKVPVAVTVVSQQLLKDNNVDTVSDLQFLVPSLTLNTNAPNEVIINLRGQGVAGNAGTPGVNIYLNEIPLASDGDGTASGGPGNFFDLENVQVLKGPQGTLFGRNSAGGAILLQTARPTRDFGGRIEGTYGNYNDREVEGVLNLPMISDVLLTRFAFHTQQRDGYTWIQGEPAYPNGIDGDNRDNWAIRGTVTFHPTDWLQNDTIVSDSQYKSRGVFGRLVFVDPVTGPAGFAAYLAQQDALGIRTVLPLSTNDVTNGKSLVINNITRIALGEKVTLRNIFGYDDEDQILQADQDNTPVAFLDAPSNPRDRRKHQTTEEVQLSGKEVGGRLDWLLGAFYLNAPKRSEFAIQDIDVQVAGGQSFYINKNSERSEGLYAHGIYDLSTLRPGLRFSAGLRYTKDDSAAEDAGSVGVCNDQSCAQALASNLTHTKSNSHALTWSVGLEYQVRPDTLVYLQSRKGYRPGGLNQQGLNGPLIPNFGPEYIQDLELGIKSDWKIATVPIRTNADVWYQNYTDIQEYEVFSPTVAYIQNAGKARLWGLELEAVAELTDNLQLGINYDHLNLQYVDFNPQVPAGTVDFLQANRTHNNPPNKYGLNARYYLPVPAEAGSVYVRADWNWQAAGGDTSLANGLGLVDSFGLLNMSVNWEKVCGKPVDVRVFAENVTNKVYITNPVPSFEPLGLGYGSAIYGAPRIYGIRLNYRFGAEAK